MALPNDLIDRIRDTSDIVDVIDRYVPLTKKGKNYFACCPFHEENTPSFSVNPEKQLYYCQSGCGAEGNVFNFLMAHQNISFPEAVKTLAAQAGIELPRDDLSAEQRGDLQNRAKLFKALEEAAGKYEAQLAGGTNPAVNDLVKGRGLSPEVISTFKLGAAGPEWRGMIDQLGGYKNVAALSESGLAIYQQKTETEKGKFYDRFRDSLIFPVRDDRGRVVSFAQRRTETNTPKNGRQPPKYMNGPETEVFKKGDVPYGLYETLQADSSPSQIVVTEGYLDVVTSHQFGAANTVATMGTSMSPTALNRLYRHTDCVTFCFDGDAAGRTASQRALFAALPLLDDAKRANFVFLPPGEDPDSFIRGKGVEAYQQYLRANSIPASDFIMRLAKHDNQRLDSVEARAQFFSNAKAMLDHMQPSTMKSLLMGRLENLTGIRPGEYLPYSVQLQQGHINGVDLGALEREVREFIGQKIGAPASDVTINWSMPELGPRRVIEQPKLGTQDVRKELGNRMRDVQRILSLETQVDGGLTVAQLLKTANTGTGQTQLMAKGLLSRYLRDTNSFDAECQIAAHHLETIKGHLNTMTPESLDPETRSQVSHWLGNVAERASTLTALSSHMDSGAGHKLQNHIDRMVEVSRDTASELERTGMGNAAPKATIAR